MDTLIDYDQLFNSRKLAKNETSMELTPETSIELTAKDSLKILSTVNLLNNLDETAASIFMLKYGEAINNSPQPVKEALFKELDKGPHKGVFNKPIDDPSEVFNIANTIGAPSGVMSSYAPPDRYEKAKLNFNNAINNMNKIALNLQIVQDDYDAASKSYLDSEERMNILVEDEYMNYPPALFTLGLGKKQAFSEVANKNPELYKKLSADKKNMIALDAQLGFPKHGSMGEESKARQRAKGLPVDQKPMYLQYYDAKSKILESLKTLNIFEGDSAKTVLPEEFLSNTGYNTLTLEEE